MVAVLHPTHAWRPDLRAEAEAVFGTLNEAHPGVRYLLRRTQPLVRHWADSRCSSPSSMRTSPSYGTHPGSSGPSSSAGVGTVSWPSTRATPCTVRTSN